MNEALQAILDGILTDIPAALVGDVLVLAAGIVRIVQSGDDPDARLAALMATAEALKAQLDSAKFGAGPATQPQGSQG